MDGGGVAHRRGQGLNPLPRPIRLPFHAEESGGPHGLAVLGTALGGLAWFDHEGGLPPPKSFPPRTLKQRSGWMWYCSPLPDASHEQRGRDAGRVVRAETRSGAIGSGTGVAALHRVPRSTRCRYTVVRREARGRGRAPSRRRTAPEACELVGRRGAHEQWRPRWPTEAGDDGTRRGARCGR